MATWEYGELTAESLSVSDHETWVTNSAVLWRGPAGGSPKQLDGSGVHGLNLLGQAGWELVGATRNLIEEEFRIRVVTTYTLKRPLRRRSRSVDPGT